MIKLDINDKKYNVPESWDEITFEVYCKAFYNLPTAKEEEDDIEKFKRNRETEAMILSRLLGEDDDFCLNLPLNIYARLNNAVKFIYDIDFLLKNAKASITIDGKRYSVPPFNEMPLRQYIDADVVMKDKENDMQYIELLSILLTAKDKDGKWMPYDGNYQELMEKLKKLKCSEALGIVYHFFKKGEALRILSKGYMKEAVSQQPHNTQSS